MSLEYGYEPTPSEIARFKHRQSQVARWVEDEDMMAEREGMFSPSVPPMGIPEGYGPDDVSDVGSSHSTPPVMFLQYPDGRSGQVPHHGANMVHGYGRSRSMSTRGAERSFAAAPPYAPPDIHGQRNHGGAGGPGLLHRNIGITIPTTHGPIDWLHGQGGPVSAPPLGGVYSRALMDTPVRPPEDIRILPTMGPPSSVGGGIPRPSTTGPHPRARSASVSQPANGAPYGHHPPMPHHGQILDPYGVPTRMEYSQSAPEARANGRHAVHTSSPLSYEYHTLGGAPAYIPHATAMRSKNHSSSSGSSGKTYYIPATQQPITSAYYAPGVTVISPTSTKVNSPTDSHRSHHHHHHSGKGHSHSRSRGGSVSGSVVNGGGPDGNFKKPFLKRIFGLGMFGNQNAAPPSKHGASPSGHPHVLRRRHSMSERY